MLPYIAILIHHLWNVRKCVVSRGIERRPRREAATPPIFVFISFFKMVTKAGITVSGNVQACPFLWGRRGFHEHVCFRVCVCVCQDNRWKACSSPKAQAQLALLPGLLIGVSGTSWKIPALPQLLTVKEDWQTTAVTHYSNHRTFKKKRRGEGGQICGAVSVGWIWKQIVSVTVCQGSQSSK